MMKIFAQNNVLMTMLWQQMAIVVVITVLTILIKNKIIKKFVLINVKKEIII